MHLTLRTRLALLYGGLVAITVALFGVVAFLVMVAGLVVASANFRLPELPKATQRPPSFFEDRWNQRFNGE